MAGKAGLVIGADSFDREELGSLILAGGVAKPSPLGVGLLLNVAVALVLEEVGSLVPIVVSGGEFVMGMDFFELERWVTGGALPAMGVVENTLVGTTGLLLVLAGELEVMIVVLVAVGADVDVGTDLAGVMDLVLGTMGTRSWR